MGQRGNIMDKFENAGIDVDEADPRYENPRIQAAYDWACEWLCDCEAAARICDQCDAYGSTVVSVTADEWYSERVCTVNRATRTITLREQWDRSNTTLRHVREFLAQCCNERFAHTSKRQLIAAVRSGRRIHRWPIVLG